MSANTTCLYAVVYDFTNRVDEVTKLFKETHWASSRTPEDISLMLQNSMFSLGLESFESGELVAYARVIGDRVFKAIVEDVVVTKTLRNKGIGHILMNALLEEPSIATLQEVELYCDPKRRRFYEDFGFIVADDQLFMQSKGRKFDKF